MYVNIIVMLGVKKLYVPSFIQYGHKVVVVIAFTLLFQARRESIINSHCLV